jgi:transposase
MQTPRGRKIKKQDNDREMEGLPVVRPNVARIDVGSKTHWVCAPKVDGVGREVEEFKATTPELQKMAEWLKQRKVESVAMESAGGLRLTRS